MTAVPRLADPRRDHGLIKLLVDAQTDSGPPVKAR
jgi:hypothetical protein